MDLMKKSMVVLGGCLACVLILYFLPYFISLNGYKQYIGKKIEDVVKFSIDVKGDVGFSILPVPAIVLKNVDFKRPPAGDSAEQPVFLNTERLFISVNLLSLARGDIEIESIIVNSGRLDYSVYRRHSTEDDMGDFLSGRRFKSLALKNSTVVFEDRAGGEVRRLYDIDMSLRSFGSSGISGSGAFRYLDNKVEGLSFLLNFSDIDNYSLNMDFAYVHKRNSIEAKLNAAAKDGVSALSGRIDLAADNLGEFLRSIDAGLAPPDVPFLKDKLRIRSNVQTANGTLILSNGTLDGGDTFANWYAEIPFEKDPKDGTYSVIKGDVGVKLDFKNLRLSRFVVLGKDFHTDIISALGDNREFLKLLSFANVKLTAANIALAKGAVTNVVFETLPIQSGLVVGKLAYSLGREAFSASGVITGVDGAVALDFDIQGTPSFSLPNRLFKNTRVGSVKGKLAMSAGSFKATSLDVSLGGDHVICNVEMKTKEDGTARYDIALRSDRISASRLTDEKIDLALILAKLAGLEGVEFALSAMFKRLSLGERAYDLFKLDAAFSGGDLKVSRLTFKDGALSSDIRGSLVGIMGGEGGFKGFSYVVTSESLRGTTIPLVRNKFVERIIEGGANRIDIKLSGPADDPDAEVHANLPGVSVDIRGRLFDPEAEYKVDFSHNELKGFLFSWGYIGDALVDYFYDNVPFKVSAGIDGYDLKNLDLDIKGNKFAGEVLRRNLARGRDAPKFETRLSLSAARLDLRAIFKRLPEVEAWADMLLKVVRTLEYDISIRAGEVIDYDGNVYGDVSLEILNARNPGRFRLSLKKGARSVSIDSEILNNRIFSGVFRVEGYALPPGMMANERMNLVDGTLSAEVKFKTDGMNFYQILSNLGGEFNARVADGTISGISGYGDILADIMNLSNINTNSVLFVLEDAFKSGALKFSSLSVSGRVDKSNVERAAFTLSAPSISASGFLTAGLIKKSLGIESVFELDGLAPEPISLMYDLSGFVNNLEGRINTGALISKINTPYLQKKKRDMCKDGASAPPRGAARPEFCD